MDDVTALISAGPGEGMMAVRARRNAGDRRLGADRGVVRVNVDEARGPSILRAVLTIMKARPGDSRPIQPELIVEQEIGLSRRQ